MAEKKEDRQVFELKNDQVKSNCLAAIENLVTDPDKPFQVIISSGIDLRSLQQNRLYWKHMGEIQKQSGEIVDDAHYRLKRKFLHPIYMEGKTKKNRLYQINYQALCTIREAGVDVDFEKLHKQLLTTTDATVKQMGQYIDLYWPDVNSQGIFLTDPKTFFQGEM